MEEGVERYRIGLEIEVDRGDALVDPGDWEVEDLFAALREGVARPRRVIRGRVIDEHEDLLSDTMAQVAGDVEHVVDLHWMTSGSTEAAIQAMPGGPRPSLETLVELRAVVDQLRRVADRLRAERL
jgi:hypothetical protein